MTVNLFGQAKRGWMWREGLGPGAPHAMACGGFIRVIAGRYRSEVGKPES
jgi:hypothetical protein